MVLGFREKESCREKVHVHARRRSSRRFDLLSPVLRLRSGVAREESASRRSTPGNGSSRALCLAELRRLKQLAEENRKQKQGVADLTQDKTMLRDLALSRPRYGDRRLRVLLRCEG